jgi:hypothetical protein
MRHFFLFKPPYAFDPDCYCYSGNQASFKRYITILKEDNPLSQIVVIPTTCVIRLHVGAKRMGHLDCFTWHYGSLPECMR